MNWLSSGQTVFTQMRKLKLNNTRAAARH